MAISIRAAGRGPTGRTARPTKLAREPHEGREPHAETARRVDRDYWLRHCEGFRVDGSEGRLGFVEEVLARTEGPREPILAVRAGRLGRRRLLISSTEIAFVVPRAQRIWLRTPTMILDTERTHL
jgi:hypothetical protein